MQKKNLLKSPIAKGISLALGASMMSPIYAEDAEETTQAEQYEDEGTIVITGIRGSLMKSMDTKRLSTGVVDAINSEDIGKFPDTNLAESLQRITGVSIDRQNGEGSRVTVRGFGADFNLVTLNGRQLPTNSGLGRSFDFGDLASEGVSGVEIYKTGRASVPTGGIGATINIKSRKPLEAPGLNMSFGVKAVNDTSTRTGDTWTPEFSGFFSDTFMDDTFGVAVVASVQERNNGSVSSTNSAWFERDGSIIPDNGRQTNMPSPGDIVAIPQQFVYNLTEVERTRTNAQVTLQYKPVERLTATLDWTYAELENQSRFNDVSFWMTPTGEQGVWTDGPIVSPLLLTEIDTEPDFPHAAGGGNSVNKLDSLGLNLEYNFNDQLTFRLDHHDSTSKRSPDSDIFGSNSFLTVGAYGRRSTTVDLRGDIPVVTTTANDPLSPDDMQLTGSVFQNSWAEMNIEQTQFAGTFEIDAEQTIDFGVAVSKVANFEAFSNVQRNTWSQGQASAIGSLTDLMTPASLTGVFDAFSAGSQINNDFFVFNFDEVAARAAFLSSLDPSNPLYLAPAPGDPRGSCGNGFCPDFNPGFGNNFQEDSNSAYFQYTLIGEIGEFPFTLIAGVRYEETEVLSSSAAQEYIRVDWTAPNEFVVIESGNEVPSGLTAEYDNTLPSIDFDMDIRDDMKLRASYSTTIARAGYGSLIGNLSVDSILRYSNGNYTARGSSGNPGLLPYESDNFDLSYEWYYGDASYFSIGYFDKTVSNFITATEIEDVVLFPDLYFPGFGPTYEAAISALGQDASNTEIREWIFTNLPNAPGVDVASGTISGVSGDGPATFDVSTSINSDQEATIDGWEIALQHDFEDTGFGFIANYTMVDGSAKFDRFSDEPQFALAGLSDTANIIGYYDRDGIQVRVAYNWRDAWFAGGVTQPGYVDEYEQWDLNASYDVDGALTIFFEAINVTNETTRGYARDYLQVNGVSATGPRYNIGFRYTY